MTHKGFDSACNLTEYVEAIPDDVDFVVRYFSLNPAKNLTADEAKALCAADLNIVSVWEGQSSAPRLGLPEGTLDAAAALLCAAKVGQPEGTVIYFAVDFDAGIIELRTRILPYFTGINAALKGRYRIGAYGSGLTLSTLRRSNLIEYSWLGGAMGWTGSKGWSGWHIKQYLPSDPYGFGFDIDLDEASGDDYGGWRL